MLSNLLNSRFILIIFAGVLCFWFRIYFTSENLPSVDLPSHLLLARQLAEHLLEGRIVFYDHTTFTGFVAFRFYGFIPAMLAAVLSYPLSILSADPVVLSTHVILVFSMALLPFSLYFAAKPLVRDLLAGSSSEKMEELTLAILCCAFSFWFLNHDKQWHGIGAAAPMNIGLFAQAFGWHLFLLHLGFLARLWIEPSRRNFLGLAIVYAFLPLTHTLTFVFCSFVFVMIFILSAERRRQLFASHMVGFCLAGFWFWPMLALMGTYTMYDVIHPKGDFLEILFRYPWFGLFKSFGSWLGGNFQLLDLIHILSPILVLIILAHPRVRRGSIAFTYFLVAVLGALIFSSDFIAASLPVGLHYYRFLTYEFLIFTILFCAVPLVLGAGSRREETIRTLVSTLAVISVIINMNLPHYERDKVSSLKGESYLSEERQLLSYFKSLPTKGRVYIEYLSNYDKHPFLSVHYVSSRLYKETGFEAVVNSHAQEGMGYRMVAGTAKLLDAKTYNSPLLFTDHAALDDKVKITQLQEFGITHVVCAEKQFCKRLRRAVGAAPTKIGRYRVFELLSAGVMPVESVQKVVVGYINKSGTLPFYLLQYYFYARQPLFLKYHLLDLTDESILPKNVRVLLVNGAGYQSPVGEGIELIKMDYKPRPYLLNNYEVHYPKNIEFDRYREVETFLNNFIVKSGLPYKQFPMEGIIDTPDFTWAENGQAFEIKNATPGRLYRVNYTYFPYWNIKGGTAYRGSEERIYIEASSDTIRGEFTAWQSMSSYIGVFLTVIGALFSVAVYRQRSL